MKRKKTIILLLTIIIILANCSVVLADINPDDYRPVIRSDDAGDAIGLAQKIIGVINVVGTILLFGKSWIIKLIYDIIPNTVSEIL